MRKRLVSIILGTMMAFSLIGCSKEATVSNGNANSEMKQSDTEKTSEDGSFEIIYPVETPNGEETEKQTETAAPEVTTKPVETQKPEEQITASHKHSYKEAVTKKATCTATGTKTYTCDCGHSYTEKINATGHSYGQYTYNNDATTMKDGTKTAICKTCGNKDTKTAEGTKIAAELEFNNDDLKYEGDNKVCVQPIHIYYKDGKVIAECYVFNTFSYSVTGIDINMKIDSKKGGVTVVKARFDNLLDLNNKIIELSPYEFTRCILTFSGESVISYGADLSNIEYTPNGVADPVTTVKSQTTSAMNYEIEVFKAQSESIQSLNTVRIKVGNNGVPTLKWADCTFYSQNTDIAVGNGELIYGKSKGITYVVMKAKTGQMSVCRVIVE